MPDINTHANVVEVGVLVSACLSPGPTIAVIDKVLRFSSTRNREGCFYELLMQHEFRTRKKISKRTSTFETASAPTMVARAAYILHGRSTICSLWVLRQANCTVVHLLPVSGFPTSVCNLSSVLPTVPGTDAVSICTDPV